MAWVWPPNSYSNDSLMKARWTKFHKADSRILADRDTPYPISQAELDSLLSFSTRNQNPPTCIARAFKEIVAWNHDHRVPGEAERAAINRIKAAVDTPTDEWGPDIIIKMFLDIDLVFFKGWLRGNVTIQWSMETSHNGQELWGFTSPSGRRGQCGIFLNAFTIFLAATAAFTSGKGMWATMLHEMCQ